MAVAYLGGMKMESRLGDLDPVSTASLMTIDSGEKTSGCDSARRIATAGP